MKNKKAILKIAKKVRRQCEIFVKSPDALGHDFANKSNLTCMCAVASHALTTALKKQNISCKMIHGKFGYASHCWVEVDGHMVDITATQFDLPPVIIARTYKGYTPLDTIKSPKDLSNWGNQKPDPKLTEKILKIKT